MTTDLLIGVGIGSLFGAFIGFFYFASFYMGRHPDRAMLELRENHLQDQHRLLVARALLNGLNVVYRWPKGFEKCEASDYGTHLGAGPYEDGSERCYWCGVIAEKVETK